MKMIVCGWLIVLFSLYASCKTFNGCLTHVYIIFSILTIYIVRCGLDQGKWQLLPGNTLSRVSSFFSLLYYLFDAYTCLAVCHSFFCPLLIDAWDNIYDALIINCTYPLSLLSFIYKTFLLFSDKCPLGQICYGKRGASSILSLFVVTRTK